MTAAPANVRNRTHEYGGGEYDACDGVVVYTELADGRVYALRSGEAPRPLTPAGEFRYADLRLHPDRGLVLAVREDHHAPGEPVNTIVALDLDGGNADGGTVLCGGADFYATPELSADGQLAWTEWDHPNMPWDSTRIRVAAFDRERLGAPTLAGGGDGESALQPRWQGPDLIFASDKSDWWNLYRWRDGTAEPLHPADAEFCPPQWVFGQNPYAVIDADRLLCTLTRGGAQQIGVLTCSTGDLQLLPGDSVVASSVAAARGSADGGAHLAAVLGYSDRPLEVAALDLAGAGWRTVKSSSAVRLERAGVSAAEAVSWPSSRGAVHGWYYPPASAAYTAPAGSLPPLIVLSHGGPTSCAGPGYLLAYQFWTSRGFAVLDVNYGGSTGYGRAYRNRLCGGWGIVDVEDCAAGAAAMGERGLADPRRLAIKGGSAGGFTTLAALTRTKAFAAGISQFGVASLEALATDTHKFESRYLDGLVGPYPQDREVYLDRSPLSHVDDLSAPILLLQGREDKVVPPNQAEMMAEAARRNGLPVALIMFDGEGHGFRRAETIKASTQAQVYFLGRIFGFEPADPVPPIPIDNLAT